MKINEGKYRVCDIHFGSSANVKIDSVPNCL